MAKQQEQVIDNSKPTVVDGTNLIAGRLCSNVAKLLRNGNRVFIINCEKIMMSGKKFTFNNLIGSINIPCMFRRLFCQQKCIAELDQLIFTTKSCKGRRMCKWLCLLSIIRCFISRKSSDEKSWFFSKE